MRHRKKGRILDRSASHRRALMGNIAASLLEKERIITTITKAKEARGTVERLITYGKKGGLNAIRLAARIIHDKKLLTKLFTDIAPSYKDREGGYTRIIKMEQRKGDAALLAIMELVGRGKAAAIRRKKKKSSTPRKKAADAVANTTDTPEVKAETPEAPAPENKPEDKK